MAKIGPTFSSELEAAGLHGLQFSWDADGEFAGRENLTQEQSNKLDEIIAAHDPTKSLESSKKKRRLF